MARVIIVGAGLTGLSTAYYLEQNGFFDYTLIEKNTRPGGLLRSESVNGFTFDYTGHFLHCSDQTFRQFLHDVVGFEKLAQITRSSSIFSHNTYTDYPFQMNLYGLPLEVITECIAEYAQRPTHISRPTTFYTWVLKHFGRGFGKHFFFPFNRKLAAYDVRRMRPTWTGRFVPNTNLNTIIAGALAAKAQSNVGYNSSFYYPTNGGIELVIKQLIRTLTAPIKTSQFITEIDPLTKTITYANGTHERYKTLISTMPLNQLLELITASSRTTLHRYASKLHCNAIININLGFATQLPHQGHWVYFPERHYPWHRLGFWHSICPQLAPPQNSSIYAEFSYLPKQISPHRLNDKINQTTAKILDFLGVSEHHIAVKNILQLDHAYVIYDTWREHNIHKILDSLRAMDIYSIGRYGAWKYSSMQEAVIEGNQTAEALCKKEKVQWKHSNDSMQASVF
ncbi:MAG: FAD-dependent oxidoreductase [Candidatus Babeliales bacterium]